MIPQIDLPKPKYVIEQKAPSDYFKFIDWGKSRENTIEPIASVVGSMSSTSAVINYPTLTQIKF